MPCGCGPKPSAYFGWPPTLTVKNVRPWNDCVNEMISIFSAPYLLDRVAARELQRGFVRFGAGVREERAIGESQVGQALRETQHRRVRVAVADVPELFALLVQHLEQFGMRVAQRRDRDAAGEVDVIACRRCPRCASRAPRSGTKFAGANTGTITSSKVLRVTLMSVMGYSLSGSCFVTTDIR